MIFNRFSTEILLLAFLGFVITDNIVWSMSTSTNKTQHFQQRSTRSQSSLKGLETSRQLGGEMKFQNENWKVWDHPEDQLAIETKRVVGAKPNRRGKNVLRNSTFNEAFKVPSSTTALEGKTDETGTKRNDCNANLQVSVLPIMLAFIAVVVGVIGVFILWIFAKKFLAAGSLIGNNNNSGYPASSGGGSGWNSQKRYDLAGFSRSLKNFDFDQLTDMVTKGIESYKKIFEEKSAV